MGRRLLARTALVLFLVSISASLASAQPQVRNQPQAATVTLSAWTSATALNATQTIFSPGDAGFEAVAIQLTQTTTITVGAATFEYAFDNSTFATIPADAVHDPTSTTWATVSLPYTLQASTNKLFVIHTKGWQALRIKLSTAITGTGSVTPVVTYLPTMPVSDVIALSPTAANFNDTSNVAQFGGAAVVTGTGASGSGIPRVTLSNDSSLAANQSVNAAQINGVTPLMGNGTTGTGAQRVTVASDNSAVAGFGVGATGGAVPANAVYNAGNGTGNLTGWVTCDNTAISNANASSGNTQLVALSSTKVVYVCGFVVTGASTTLNTVKLVYGTGSACATGQTDISLAVPIQAATSTGPYGATVMPPANVLWKTAASNALCVNLSAAQAVNVQVWYTQF